MHGDITTQAMFTHAAKNTQESAQARPHAFRRVGVNFADAIAIIIPRPLFVTMSDHRTWTGNRVVAVIFIGIDMRSFARKLLDMLAQRDLFRIRHHAQAHFARLSSHRPQNRGTVIGKGAASPAFVGATAGWIGWLKVFASFFPPHSETFHRFQRQYRGGGLPVATARRLPAPVVAMPARFCTPGLIRGSVERSIVPGGTLVTAAPPARVLTDRLQTPSRCRDGKCPGNPY